jgi:hypothetical protein
VFVEETGGAVHVLFVLGEEAPEQGVETVVFGVTLPGETGLPSRLLMAEFGVGSAPRVLIEDAVSGEQADVSDPTVYFTEDAVATYFPPESLTRPSPVATMTGFCTIDGVRTQDDVPVILLA